MVFSIKMLELFLYLFSSGFGVLELGLEVVIRKG